MSTAAERVQRYVDAHQLRNERLKQVGILSDESADYIAAVSGRPLALSDLRELLALIHDVQAICDEHHPCLNKRGDVSECSVLSEINERLAAKQATG